MDFNKALSWFVIALMLIVIILIIIEVIRQMF